MEKLSHFAAQQGVFFIVPLLFAVVGTAACITCSWGLITGGPRARNVPGAPYLYDRLYYLIYLAMLPAWFGALISFSVPEILGQTGIDDTWDFMICWAVGAICMGLLLGFRRDMMVRGARYQAQYAMWPWRLYNRMQLAQLERMNAMPVKFVPFIFLIAGTVILIVSGFHVPATIAHIRADVVAFGNVLTKP